MEKKLRRNENDKMIGGVCSGLAEYFDMDVTLVRVAFLLLAIFGGGGVLGYIILWIAIPAKPYFPNFGPAASDYRVYDEYAAGQQANPAYTAGIPTPPKKKKGNGSIIAGMVLVLLGIIFLADEFDIFWWFNFGKLWPLFIIIPGILMIARSGRKKEPFTDYTTTDTTHTTNTTQPAEPAAEKPADGESSPQNS